ncbi:uncharacterized protein N7446_008319 [Penicillium canescens]|uniref:uncharacterized protein n=1 Tax=Penicillium canescens TaxID=5083 RepID=UPI0026E0E7DA|nr:uncharacterized protein N7446_008319 [Penicillium canescens]KAJ6058736.1 hypothetical protein N7446_008319 [Penicillium canescens]
MVDYINQIDESEIFHSLGFGFGVISRNRNKRFAHAIKARSSWRRALMSSPPNPIFSFGMSRGPSPDEPWEGAPFGFATALGGGGAVDAERGASAAPFTNELIPGTALPALGSKGFGDVPMGLRGCNAGCSCFGRRGLCVCPLGCTKGCTGTRGDEATRGSTIACPYTGGLRCSCGWSCIVDLGDRVT